jgi:membrane-associated phospholipid phosphatase
VLGSPLLSEALVYSRDGIVGNWQAPALPPDALMTEHTDNLERWGPGVRAALFDFELTSRLAFTSDASNTNPRGMRLWHLDVGGTPTIPTGTLRHVIDISRPDESLFLSQLEFVDRHADLRGDRAAEILTQLNGGIAFVSAIAFLHPERTPKTLELVATVLRLANHVEMRFKHAFACRRPHEFSPQIQPMILTPTHGSFPSGHAAEAFITAYVLWKLLRETGTKPYGQPGWGTQFMQQAARIAINRTVAGVHFPIDSAAGAVLGLTLGRYFVRRCKTATAAANFTPWSFNGSAFPTAAAGQPAPLDADFYWKDLYDETLPNPHQKTTGYATPGNRYSVPMSPILRWLWRAAKAEWQ